MSTFAKEFKAPEYHVRISRRSQRVYLRLNPLGRLEVVIPTGFDQARIPEILYQRREWITRTQEKQQAIWARSPEQYSLTPDAINLQALSEVWQVEYVKQDRQRIRLEVRPDQLSLHVTIPLSCDDEEKAISLRLQKWLSQYAKQRLLPWLEKVSTDTGFMYNKACIRAQKTRWGSCSSSKDINLNRNLLFLSPELVRYLFVHELCHTRQMDHSPRFWHQVAEFEPEYRKFDRALGLASGQLPLWVHV
ncbi:MAG: M48 family metallopeptidase [Gammaproteobacteria bacterium]|nr:M48 family metallopeptidase [Gammaproteobacteria bacterium]